MDPVNRRRVIDLVRKLGREGKTVVVSSHILYEVEAMTRRVLLVHNGRILAEGDVREIRDLLDEHPHTVALRAREPRRLAARDRGLRRTCSRSRSARKGEWVTVQTARPDEFYGGAPRGGPRGGGHRDVLARRGPGVGVPVPGGAMRDTCPAAARSAAAAAARCSTSRSRGCSGAGAACSWPCCRRLPVRASRCSTAWCWRRSRRRARSRRQTSTRCRGRLLLDPQRAAAGGALLRHLAHRGRGRGPHHHVPADPAPDPRRRSSPASSRPTWSRRSPSRCRPPC